MNQEDAVETGERCPKADECRAQLRRILSSPHFQATQREHRFLAYVVEETITGRSDRVKAYSVALEVFGRDASFDPQRDPIVRVVAGHLRRALENYYLSAGRSDSVEITIPKGSYVPTFGFRDADFPELPGPSPASSGAVKHTSKVLLWGIIAGLGIAAMIAFAIWLTKPPFSGVTSLTPEIPRVLVTKFEDLTRSGSSDAVARGLTQEVVGHLSKFREIVVLQGTETGGSVVEPPPRFTLVGSVDLTTSSFRLRVRFINREDGTVLWANNFEGPLKAAEVVRAQSDIASNVASALAQSYGVIFQADAKRTIQNPPDDWTAYACTLSYYSYRADLDKGALLKVRECLETAVVKFPEYATAWALLSQTQLEEIRFRFPRNAKADAADLERALEMARNAVRIDPYNTRGMQAEMFALFMGKEFEAAKRVGEKAREINPNDTELMGEYGYRLALSGDWDNGCPLIATARQRNPGIFGYYESGLALCAYFKGDLQEAVMWIRQSKLPKNPIYHMMAAAIYAESELTDSARNEAAWLCKNTPDLLNRARQELSQRLGKPADVEHFLNSLKKAGLITDEETTSCATLNAIEALDR